MFELDTHRWLFSLYMSVKNLDKRFQKLENTLSELRDELTSGLQDLADAIAAVSGRVNALPDADAITQADIDRLKEEVSDLNQVASAAPAVPTSPDSNVPTPDGTSSSNDGGTPAPSTPVPGSAS
jgi:hypothetical protein